MPLPLFSSVSHTSHRLLESSNHLPFYGATSGQGSSFTDRRGGGTWVKQLRDADLSPVSTSNEAETLRLRLFPRRSEQIFSEFLSIISTLRS